MHQNAFTDDLKFYRLSISGRYLINPTNAFRDGFYQRRKLFSGKLRYGRDFYRLAADVFGNMQIWNHYVNTALLRERSEEVNKWRESHLCEGYNIISSF